MQKKKKKALQFFVAGATPKTSRGKPRQQRGGEDWPLCREATNADSSKGGSVDEVLVSKMDHSSALKTGDSK